MPVNSKAVGQDVAYWLRLPEGDAQKTYDYLINSMERYLDRIQMDKNQEARRAAMQRGLGFSALGAGAGGDDGGRGAVGASSGGAGNGEGYLRGAAAEAF